MVSQSISLRGACFAPTDASAHRPTLLSMVDQDFVARLLQDLGSEEGHGRLQTCIASKRTPEGLLRLFQPVHRIFNLAVVEAYCPRPGEPRLDPAHILEAGLVLRRLLSDGSEQGWMRKQGRVVGWRAVASAADPASYDPSPKLRKQRELGSNAAVLKRSWQETQARLFEEDYVSLLTAPAQICQRGKRTFLYGYVRVTSNEQVETDAAELLGEPPVSLSDIRENLPDLLKAGDLRKANVDTIMETFDFLSEWVGLFSDREDVAPLRALLDTIPMVRYPQESVWTFLRHANERQEQNGGTLWPAISASCESAIVAAIHAIIQARWRTIAPGEGRFDEADARYTVRAFLRVQDAPDCPPRTLWSEASEPFEIVPWYEGSDRPPVQIRLPEVDAQTLPKLKPNVAFQVPPSIQQFMQKLKLDDLMEGNPKSSSLDIGMICAFSIPIITICAFFVLQIFLSLLHFAFGWLPFVKICIPYPKKT